MMALREWVRLPTAWIEDDGLRNFRWSRNRGSNNIAALMVLTAIAHNANDENGLTRMTYDNFEDITGLSRAKISGGLDVLTTQAIIDREPDGKSTYQLCDYDKNFGWGKLPAKRLYTGKKIAGFTNFHLRQSTELNAIKLYFLFVARRDNASNFAQLSYDKITDYTGIDQHQIKSALSFLAANSLIYVEQRPSGISEFGVSNAYRFPQLDTRNHLGTRGSSF